MPEMALWAISGLQGMPNFYSVANLLRWFMEILQTV